MAAMERGAEVNVEAALAALESGDNTKLERQLRGFNRQNSQTFKFDQNEQEARKAITSKALQ